MKEFNQSMSDNYRLRTRAKQDSLTGLLNAGNLELEIDEALKNKVPGVLLIIDVDDFHQINDEYGHMTGDQFLRSLARVMNYLFNEKDIIGRMSGNEFAIFLPGQYSEELIDRKVKELTDGAAQGGKELGIRGALCFTSGADFSRDGDTFHSLYERTFAAMQKGKQKAGNVLNFYETAMGTGTPVHDTLTEQPESMHDMIYIRRQLEEPDPAGGTYCQDYDAFLSIYRFLERGLDRTGLKVHLILLTMTNENGSFVALKEREYLMEHLKENLLTSLRFSDIFTQYSSCQFLAMTPGATEKDMDIIASRITNAFRSAVPDRDDIQLFFSFYPLKPSGKGIKSI